MLEILNQTPRWVFALFIGLVYLGLQQSKSRTVTLQRLAVLPVAMPGLSFYGVWSTFNGSAIAVTCWFGAAAATSLLTQTIDFSRGVRYLPETRSFVMPGSWLPLALMMGIFFTKYAVGIVLAQHGELRGVASFIGAVSLIYGLWSGMFFGRTAQVLAVHGKQAFA